MFPEDVAMLGWTLLVPKVAIATENQHLVDVICIWFPYVLHGKISTVQCVTLQVQDFRVLPWYTNTQTDRWKNGVYLPIHILTKFYGLYTVETYHIIIIL